MVSLNGSGGRWEGPLTQYIEAVAVLTVPSPLAVLLVQTVQATDCPVLQVNFRAMQ